MTKVIVGIDALAYYLPPKKATVEELEKAGKLTSKASVLRSFGFDKIHLADEETHIGLAKKAAEKLFSQHDLKPKEIDVILFSGATTPSFMMYDKEKQTSDALLSVTNIMDFFKYPASRLQYELGMTNASVIGLGQQGCSTLFSAIRLARDMIQSESDINHILCVSADVFPREANREVIYNVLSDGAGCLLVSKDAPDNEIISIANITKGYYWDGDKHRNELIASYFPTAKYLILETLKKAKLTIDDIRLLIPHNVSMRSWEILLALIGFPKKRFYGKNIALHGHAIGADNIVNLKDALDESLVNKGEYILLFNFGFGVNWSCIVLKH